VLFFFSFTENITKNQKTQTRVISVSGLAPIGVQKTIPPEGAVNASPRDIGRNTHKKETTSKIPRNTEMASVCMRVIGDTLQIVLIMGTVVVYAATLRNAGPALVVPTLVIPITALLLQMVLLAGSCRINGCISRNGRGVFSYEAMHEYIQVLIVIALFVFGMSDSTIAPMHAELLGCASLLTAFVVLLSRICVRINAAIHSRSMTMHQPVTLENSFEITDPNEFA